MAKKKDLSILFIGNSHTYYNDMPLMVKQRAEDEDFNCRVTMIAHGGWYLSQHAEEPDVRFNILYGGYDYVVLQEHAHPFGPEEKFLNAAVSLNEMIRKAGSTPIIYECWSRKDEPEKQKDMVESHKRLRLQSMRCGLPLVKTGGATRKAGRILNCMPKMARTLLLQDQISLQSTSGKKS